jgi:polysaccharide biosynthesis protein PslH
MRILYLSHVLPYPLDAGPKVRAYYTLRHLSAAHDVTLLSFVRGTDTPESIAHLKTFCRDVKTVPIHRSKVRDALYLLRSLATGEPFLIARDWRDDMLTAIQAAFASCPFDAIHADQLAMAPYALRGRDAAPGARARIVLDQHNAVYQIPLRLAQSEGNPVKRSLLQREARTMAGFEVDLCHKFDQVVFVTDVDRAALADHGLRTAPGQSRVIPISIDPAATAVRSRRPRRVTFVGGLHWPPNAAGVRWFESEIWPVVSAAVPEAVFTVIGNNPPDAPAAMHRNVERLGYVEDPQPYLDETAVFVVPLLAGGGMRVKILNAWAGGLPVVSTNIGAEGILTRDGGNILLADIAADFAGAVIRLLRDPALGDAVGAEGRSTVEAHYNWRHVYEAWNEVYQ